MALMGLAIKQGQEVVVEADGEDEEEAIQAIKTFMERRLI